MLSADRIAPKALKPGFKPLEPLLLGNIVTLRSHDKRWLFELVVNILVRSHEDGQKALYLHWVDYHKRFWTLDYDFIMRLAKKENKDILDSIFFLRAFSRDNNETEKNWENIKNYGKFDLIILDSISELYEESKRNSLDGRFGRPHAGDRMPESEPGDFGFGGFRGAEFGSYGPAGNGWGSPRAEGERIEQKPMTYSIGKFVQLCIKNDCPGIVLDYSEMMHPYLAHVSSVIIDIETNLDEMSFNVRKHPSMPEGILRLPRKGQYTLRRWL
ncbi:MAG: hypothetical protein AB1324_02270 [Candidatus Micrarchaeota archaeon]